VSSSETSAMGKLWGGRFRGDTDETMWRFNASIDVDRRLASADARASIAYARALGRVNVLTSDEVTTLVAGLERIRGEFESGAFRFLPGDEDIHTAVERRLGEIVGPLAGKLHTGRSRNDQVATDVRLFLMDSLDVLTERLRAVQRAIVARAKQHLDVLMPGYTHLQPAQPVRFSHWLMSYFWMLQRDCERCHDLGLRVSCCPLGAGALAGNAYSIDREALAQDLGFRTVSQNSMDAVSDRDMIIETLSWGAMLGLHLSRLAEDLILWSTREFGFVRLDERYTTGSSLMPQKRNPDSLELVRGKSGRLVGNLTRMMVVSKGLPSTYDKDLQEDKEPLFDTLDTLDALLTITAGIVETVQIRAEAMRKGLVDGLLATDLADYLVKTGVPFREAHELIGRAVLACEQRGIGLRDLPLSEYQEICPAFGPDLYDVLDYEASVEARDVTGGTSRSAVMAQIERALARLT